MNLFEVPNVFTNSENVTIHTHTITHSILGYYKTDDF